MVHGQDCCNRRAMMWPNSGFPGCFPHPLRPDLPRIMPWRASIGPKNPRNPAAPMTMSVANIAEDASPMRGPLPLWVGVLIYALFLVAGNKLLIDPDTMWQITVGQWISDHRAVPATDIYSFTMHGQPWISTQWLAQVLYAKAYAISGWSGPVVLAATAIAATFGLFARFLSRRLSESTTLVFIAAALALTVPHLLARPHVLALPVMVAWVGGLIAAADRRGAPSFWWLPLMALWANLHGGFVFGLVLIAPVALDAVLSADVQSRKSLALRWAAFGVAALAASCCTLYGWNSLLASQKILGLGGALPLIMKWRPANFVSLGAFEVCLLAGTFVYASVHRFEPHTRGSPVAAVAALKQFNLARVFNDYDFGGYLIASGVATFIDGRTELFGEKFFVDHNDASGLMQPENLFRLLDEYKIEATLMRTQSAATKLLDHVDGWQKIYSDDIATIHLRKSRALHTAEPAVDSKAK